MPPSANTLASALNALGQGLIVMIPAVAQTLRAVPQSLSPQNLPDPLIDALTPRELEVINLIAEGLPNKNIAAKLGISEHTVKFHVEAILRKLDARSRAEAVAKGLSRSHEALDL